MERIARMAQDPIWEEVPARTNKTKRNEFSIVRPSAFFTHRAAHRYRGGVTFLDLPSEIRMMIYSHMLSQTGRQVFVWGEQPSTLQGLIQPDQGPIRWDATLGSFDIDIIHVNRIIHTEATPVFYASNVFHLWSMATAKTFLTEIGVNRKFLRRIRFQTVRLSPQVKPVVTLLLGAVNLEHVDVLLGWNGKTIDGFLREFKPLMDMLLKRHESTTTILDRFSFRDPLATCKRRNCTKSEPFGCRGCQALYDDLRAEFVLVLEEKYKRLVSGG